MSPRRKPAQEFEASWPAGPTHGRGIGSGILDADRTELHPGFPVVQGRYRLTDEWTLTLPLAFNRRVEGVDMCLWRPGVTVWLSAWKPKPGERASQRLAWVRDHIPEDAYALQDVREDGLVKISYRVDENEGDGRQPVFSTTTVGPDGGHLLMSIYFDDPDDLTVAQSIFASVEHHRALQH